MSVCVWVGAVVLLVVAGSIHHPMRAAHRVDELPEQFQALLVPGKMQHVLCTGNLCSKEMYERLKTLAKNTHVVRGDLDDNVGFPETKVVR